MNRSNDIDAIEDVEYVEEIEDLIDLEEAAALEQGEDSEDLKSASLDRVEVVHGYVRELRYDNLPVPSRDRTMAPADLVGLGDAEVLALIDVKVVSTQCGTQRLLLEKDQAFAHVLTSAARQLGLRPLHSLEATVRDLVQALVLSPDTLSQKALALVTVAVDHLLVSGETPLVAVQPQWAKVLATAHADRDGCDSSLADAVCRVEEIGARLMQEFRDKARFPALLAELIVAKNVSADVLARKVGMPSVVLQDWLKGATPSRSRIGHVAAIERELSAPSGTLTRHLPARALKIFTDDVLTSDIRQEFESLMIPLACLGDDWCEIEDGERKRRIAEVRERFVEASPYRQLRLAMSEESRRYPPLTPQMEKEFAEISAFKGGKKLIPGLRQKLSCRRDGRRQGGKWRESTRELQHNLLARLLGCAHDLIGADPVAMAAIADASLILFCRADAVQRMIHEMARRRFVVMKRAGFYTHCEEPETGMVFVDGDASKVWMIAGFLSESTGYLRKHRPELMQVPGWIDAEWIERARIDWSAVADEERAMLAEFAKQLESEDTAVREPRSNVQALLDTERPLQPVLDALSRFDADRPSYFESPLRAARHDRDHLVLRLWLASRLRRENLTRLTYDPKSNRGKLRRDARGIYLIVVPRAELKNANSSAYAADGSDLVIELDPFDEALYEAIERWVAGPGCSRAVLHGDDAGPFLFPGTQGPEKPVASATIYRIIVFFSALYLADLSFRQGIPGVRPFGVHTIRLLVASHILIETGSFQDAANALFDDVATVQKAYAWLTHRQQSQMTNKLLARTLHHHAPGRSRLVY